MALTAFYCMVMSIVQIVAEADIPSITTENVWDHFVEVMIPIIQKYQVEFPVQKESESTIGQTLVQFAETMHLQQKNSEVSNLLQACCTVCIILIAILCAYRC